MASMLIMSDRLRIAVFFSLIFGLLFFLGRAGLPLAHEWLDLVAMRDSGTMFNYLESRPDALRSLVLATLQHVKGPLHYIAHNTYCLAVGNLLPLNPATMQFPNIILAFLTCLFAFLMCRKFFSTRMAYFAAVTFALGPWLVVAIRFPAHCYAIPAMLHFATIYFFASLMKDPDSLFYQIAAPTALAVYIFYGQDWPTYLFCLFVFFVLSGRVGTVLRNSYNVIPAIVILLMIIWTVILTLKFGEEGLRSSRLVYPFWRLGMDTAKFAMERLWHYTLLPWGPQLLLAFAGLVAYVTAFRKQFASDKVSGAILGSMCVWLLLATPPLAASSGIPQYVYVVAMPSALLAAFALSMIRVHYGFLLVLTMALAQFYFITDGNFRFSRDDNRRILAAACFLIEQRPDLLASDRIPFASGGNPQGIGGKAGAVTSYMRGRSKCLVMPYEFPATRFGTLHPASFDAFVTAYKNEGKILADWIILGSEALSDKNPARDFFKRFLDDPNVRWIARFREEKAEEIYIGEVIKGGGVPASNAPLMDVKSLSDLYEAKYDRISFLKNNMEYAFHY